MFLGRGQPGDKDVYHVVRLQHFDFEIVEHVLEVVELIDGVMRV